MGARMDAAWPLFALRLRSERLVLRLPTDDDLVDSQRSVAKAGIHPPGEMPFGVAWSTIPSPDFERGFMQHHWAKRAAWTPDDWWLNLVVELDGAPIGSQSIHADHFAVMRTVDTGSWLGRAFQGQGYGKEMRAAVLGLAFDGLGARAGHDRGIPRQRRVERRLALTGLRGERVRKPRARRASARDTRRLTPRTGTRARGHRSRSRAWTRAVDGFGAGAGPAQTD